MTQTTPEETWFVTYTWNSERQTDALLLKAVNNKVLKSIRKPIEEYLLSLGFKQVENKNKPDNCIGWKLSILSKTFELVLAWEANRMEFDKVPTGYPSQIKEHMTKHKAVIQGKQFGL